MRADQLYDIPEIEDLAAGLDAVYHTATDARSIYPLGAAEEINDESEHTDDQIIRKFPQVAWTGLFAKWRDIVAPCTEASLESLWSAFLIAAGLILGRSVWRSSPRPLYPNFFLLLLGQTGDSRKSTVIWLAEELLQRVGVNIQTIRGIVSTEGLLEALAQQEDTRALGYADEFRSLLSVAKRKGTQDIIPRLQSLHSCPREDTITRREKSTTAIKPFFSFITATPQAFVDDLLGEMEITGGFLNRFVIVTGETQEPKPLVKPPTDAAWDSVVMPLREVYERSTANPHQIEFTSDAEQLWIDFYTQWRTKRTTCNPKIADLSARTFEHVLKMALVYSALASEQMITPRSLATAIALGGWLESNALSLFGDTGLDRRTKAQNAIVGRLKKAKDHQMYVRDLQRGLNAKVTGADFRDGLKILADNEQIRVSEIVHSSGQKRKVATLILSDTRHDTPIKSKGKVSVSDEKGAESDSE